LSDNLKQTIATFRPLCFDYFDWLRPLSRVKDVQLRAKQSFIGVIVCTHSECYDEVWKANIRYIPLWASLNNFKTMKDFT